MKLIEEKVFTSNDLKDKELGIAQYELCTFQNIDFSNGSISESKFVECRFVDCDLSLVRLTDCLLQDVKFIGCKLLGLYFETVKPFLFQVNFEQCNIESSSFTEVNLEGTYFDQCKMLGVDFTNANLSLATLDECNLQNAIFLNTNFAKTDLRTARNFSIDIKKNLLGKAIVSKANLEGFLKELKLDFKH